MENNNNKPIYKIEVKLFQCSVEIEVNGIPCFSYFDEPQIATDIPINNLIFSSGKQIIKFRIYPLSNSKTFHKDSKIELNVFVKEANGFYLKKEVISSYNLKQSIENKNIFEDLISFQASIPYNLDTNKLIHSFADDAREILLSELYAQYSILAKYIINNDLIHYNEFTKTRFEDFATAHYLDDNKKTYYLNKALFTYKEYNLSLISQEQYHLKFCYGNKLIYLQKPKNSPGLILEDKTSKEEGLHFIESAIFYRDDKGVLKLFR